MHEIVIIIVNYKNYSMTQTCLNNLIKINVQADIVVVDNDSPNDSFAVLSKEFSRENISVIQSEKNGGYSYGNNFGIKYALAKHDYNYICIMNPDVILETDYLAEICENISIHREIASISTLMFMNGRFETEKITWKIPINKDIYKNHFLLHKENKVPCSLPQYSGSLVDVEALPGSFFIMKAKVFEEINFFDENVFMYNEENILGLKLKANGYHQVLDTSHYFLHNHESTENENVLHNYKYDFKKILQNYAIGYKSRKYLCKNYLSGKYLLRLCFVNILNYCLLWAKHLISIFLGR